MPIKEKYDNKIKKIVDDFGLYNKSDKKNIREFIFNDPGVVLADLLLKREKGKLKDAEVIDFLKDNLKLSTEKAEKIKKRLDQEIFSEDEKVLNFERSEDITKKDDKYREQIN